MLPAYRKALSAKKYLSETTEEPTPPKQDESKEPAPHQEEFWFKLNEEEIKQLVDQLKNRFVQGEEIKELFENEGQEKEWHFIGQQNQLVELLQRMEYNDKLEWTKRIALDSFLIAKCCFNTNKSIKKNSITNVFRKDSKLQKDKRLCNFEWLPFRTHSQRKKD